MTDYPRIVFVTPTLAQNSLGRTYSLWLLAQALGWGSRVVSVEGEEIWEPLRNSQFANVVTRVDEQDFASGKATAGADLVIAVKPLPSSFGMALLACKSSGAPLLLDIDDPDLITALSFRDPLRALAREVTRVQRQRQLRQMNRWLVRVPKIVSNPVLQAKYGGTVIPHARLVRPAGLQHTSSRPNVAFIGTNYPHKGVPELRRAISTLSKDGYTFTITDNPPADPKPWERWVGRTSIERGLELTDSSDIVVLPSRNTSSATGQLPAKLIDAMISARAVITSDIAPLGWALGGHGLIAKSGSSRSLAHALIQYKDPGVRQRAGEALRAEALRRFTVDALVEPFAAAVSRVLMSRGSIS